jgi:flagellar basal body-associated protein FliL
MRGNENQSKTKSKVTLIALCLVAFMFLLAIVSVVEIRQIYLYKQRISSQERQIKELQNAKDYYKSLSNNEPYDADDIIFEEE